MNISLHDVVTGVAAVLRAGTALSIRSSPNASDRYSLLPASTWSLQMAIQAFGANLLMGCDEAAGRALGKAADTCVLEGMAPVLLAVSCKLPTSVQTWLNASNSNST